jgi:hypothetical protein
MCVFVFSKERVYNIGNLGVERLGRGLVESLPGRWGGGGGGQTKKKIKF